MAYETENSERTAKGLLPIQCASTVARAPLPWPRHLPKPASVIARQAAARAAAPVASAAPAPARVAAPARPANRGPMPLVWVAAGLSGAGNLGESRGHAAHVEGWSSEAVARAAARINDGTVPCKLTVNHAGEALATVANGGLQCRCIAGDLLFRFRPEQRHAWVVDAIRERERNGGFVGASIEARNVRATTNGQVRLVDAGDICAISLCLNCEPAFWRSGARCGGPEGDVTDMATAVKWMSQCDALTR